MSEVDGKPNSFYPMNEQQRRRFDSLSSHLMCIDDDIEVAGSLESGEAHQLVIQFQSCAEQVNCRSRSEVNDWLKKKQVSLISNQMRLDHANSKPIEESKITLIPIDTRTPQEIVYAVKTTELETNDMMSETRKNALISVSKKDTQSYESEDEEKIKISLAFERDLNLQVVQI